MYVKIVVLYNPSSLLIITLKDPHSLQYEGQRHISNSGGAMWGNIRHGKGLRFDAHKDLLDQIFFQKLPKLIFDDGANRGHFARYVSSINYVEKYVGFEPDELCFESYKNNGTPKINLGYSEYYTTNLKFDFIYSSHTLEHVNSVKEPFKTYL